MVKTRVGCRRLTEFELAEVTRPTTSPSPTTGQGKIAPFLPLEIVREIIRHATDTFPAPSSIHHPSPSTLQTLSPPQYSHFPYSSHSFEEDREVHRKLHALSMRIKLSVSRVSRQWRDVAVEFLFNSVRIHDSIQIALLWHALEGDAKRRGEQASKENVARPGIAPWWIRELWIDLRPEKVGKADPRVARNDSLKDLPSFDLFDLLKICPNIVVYRVPGNRTRGYQEPDRVIGRVLGHPGERRGEAHDAQRDEHNVPAICHQLELWWVHDYVLHSARYGDPPISRPHILTLLRISSLDLGRMYLSDFNGTAHDAIRLQSRSPCAAT
ncbi:hypothetical protein FS837_003660 [Tulasnella sp. UAMH 9824]|nr:hypothetical protein FS837_003660 [Tulasnella sp. UAMH 9824]